MDTPQQKSLRYNATAVNMAALELQDIRAMTFSYIYEIKLRRNRSTEMPFQDECDGECLIYLRAQADRRSKGKRCNHIRSLQATGF